MSSLITYGLGGGSTLLTYGLGSGSVPDIRVALVAHLLALSDVTDVVGANVFADMIPQHVPKGAASLVYQVISNSDGYHLRGRDGVAQARIELKVSSRDKLDCLRCKKAVRDALSGFAGTLGESVDVTETLLKDERDHYDPPVDKSDVGIYAISQDYLFRYREE